MAAAHGYVLASIPSTKITKMPRAVLKNDYKMKVPYKLKQGQSRTFHELPSGLNMEVIYQKALQNKNPDKLLNPPPLVFVHGSFHAAWCWAEHWLPFFSQNGFDSYALSLLGQGESDAPDGSVAGSLQTHAADIADFIQKQTTLSPVLIGHSFGGLIVQYYIANLEKDSRGSKCKIVIFLKWELGNLSFHKRCFLLAFSVKNTASRVQNLYGFGHLVTNMIPKVLPFALVAILNTGNMLADLAGAVLVCSVPPTGNSGLVRRYLFSKPVAAFKVTMSLAAKAFQTSLPLCKETFFSQEMDDNLVLRYQELMTESSRMPLFDLRKLNASLPVASVSNPSTEVLVMGAADDFIVDAKGLEETGSFYGVQPVCVEGVAHDMMLDSSWEKGAELILSWVKSLDGKDLVYNG